jgi:hypothetical protein
MSMTAVQVAIERFVDEYQPGIVECRLVDASGEVWTFREKIPLVTSEDLDAFSAYPRPGRIACTVINDSVDSEGRQLLTIDTDSPWQIEAKGGATVFVVLADQVGEW